MNKRNSFFTLIALVSILALPVRAQTAAPATNLFSASGTSITMADTGQSNAPSILSPFKTAASWLTTFSTNTWAGYHGYVETGPAYQNQVQFADDAAIGINVWNATADSGLNLDNEVMTAGVAGTLVSEAAYAAWRYDIKDVQLQFGGGAGYDFTQSKVFPSVMAEIQKKWTQNTYGAIEPRLDWEGKKSPLTIIAKVGISF